MKALVLRRYGIFAYEEVPDPSCGADEVTVRVKACAICGSDVHGMDGSSGRRQPPVIMGHEASGIIEEVGSGVPGWKPGDAVTFDSTVYCGACRYCRAGSVNLCNSRRVLGVSCDEYHCDGAMAEYVAVPSRVLYRLPPGVSFVQAAMIEPLAIAAHAVERTPLRLGDSCVVVGAGNIGLLLIQLLRARGAGRIIAVDPERDRCEVAALLGAHSALEPSCDLPDRILEISDGEGVDRAFDVVGQGDALQSALGSVRKGGSVTLVGNLSPRIEFAQQLAVTREIDLIASCASCGEYPACIELVRDGTVDVRAVISKVAPLEEGAEWFRRLYEREKGLMKVVLQPAV